MLKGILLLGLLLMGSLAADFTADYEHLGYGTVNVAAMAQPSVNNIQIWLFWLGIWLLAGWLVYSSFKNVSSKVKK
jgi:hypothetical protein